MISNYREAKIQNREALRRGLLDAASQILVNEGLEALTMRRIAQEVQASTQVLYTLFGNKEGLFEQLYIEGFGRVRQRFEAVTEPDALARLLNLGRAYREFGLLNPTYFAVLFNKVIPGFKPSLQTIQDATSIFDIFEQTVRECMESGALREANPIHVAKVFVVSIHGAISLELIGYLAPYLDNPKLPEQVFELTMSNTIKGFSML